MLVWLLNGIKLSKKEEEPSEIINNLKIKWLSRKKFLRMYFLIILKKRNDTNALLKRKHIFPSCSKAHFSSESVELISI